MLLKIDALLDYAFPAPADVLLQIEAAAMTDQRLVSQSLVIESDHPIRAVAGEEGIGQRCWARAERRLVARYAATVRIEREPVLLEALPATPVAQLPAGAIPYLLPSRYCEADRFDHFVRTRFPGLAGGALATALAAWVQANIAYDGSVMNGGGAMQTFAERRGVCRDHAHLLVALARAGEIPARCVSAYAPGVDPPDFHAVAELWLDGAWRLIDATGMGSADDLARVAVGRDATDIAFMTVFGSARMMAQHVSVARIDE